MFPCSCSRKGVSVRKWFSGRDTDLKRTSDFGEGLVKKERDGGGEEKGKRGT